MNRPLTFIFSAAVLVAILTSFQKPKCKTGAFVGGDLKVIYKTCDGLLTDTAKFYQGSQLLQWETWADGKYKYALGDFRKFKGDQGNFGKFTRAFYDKVKILKYNKPVKGQLFEVTFLNMPITFPSRISVPNGIVRIADSGIKIELKGNKGDTLKVFVQVTPNGEQKLWISEVIR